MHLQLFRCESPQVEIARTDPDDVCLLLVIDLDLDP